METATHYVLIVANRTAATPTLLERVRDRALRGACEFTLLVPAPEEEARTTLELAVPLLENAAGGRVKAAIGPPDPEEAVERTLAGEHFDEIMLSTLAPADSAWLARDLAARIERPSVPVAVVEAKASADLPDS